jgi:hypothetical protein
MLSEQAIFLQQVFRPFYAWYKDYISSCASGPARGVVFSDLDSDQESYQVIMAADAYGLRIDAASVGNEYNFEVRLRGLVARVRRDADVTDQFFHADKLSRKLAQSTLLQYYTGHSASVSDYSSTWDWSQARFVA